MPIRFEYRCPDCVKEYSANQVQPECPFCGYQEVEEGGEE